MRAGTEAEHHHHELSVPSRHEEVGTRLDLGRRPGADGEHADKVGDENDDVCNVKSEHRIAGLEPKPSVKE